ncbi:MAG: PASTA domain-containing protein, partial [Jatrophihabitantaceae bacterium]
PDGGRMGGAMGPIQRAVRRALNPMSTRVTMLVQGGGTRRALGARRGLPRGYAGHSPRAPVAGRRPQRPAARAFAGPVRVPNVIGLSWPGARAVLDRAGLVAVGPDPDRPATATWADGVVVDQRPVPGTQLPPRSPVMVWLEQGPGSAGDREPRRPVPGPRAASGMRDEQSDEAVG